MEVKVHPVPEPPELGTRDGLAYALFLPKEPPRAGILVLLHEHAPAVALRGSSMGGFTALHVAALEPGVAAVVAICPAPEDLLLRIVRSEEELEWRLDREAVEPWLSSLSVYEAVRRIAPDTDLLLMHAQGDAQVPWTVSEELHARARSERKRLLVLPGGHHRSVQHDGELHGESLRFIERA